MKLYRVSIKIYPKDDYPYCEVDFITANDENEAFTKHEKMLVKKFPDLVAMELKSVCEFKQNKAV